jgi:hypothetical protein
MMVQTNPANGVQHGINDRVSGRDCDWMCCLYVMLLWCHHGAIISGVNTVHWLSLDASYTGRVQEKRYGGWRLALLVHGWNENVMMKRYVYLLFSSTVSHDWWILLFRKYTDLKAKDMSLMNLAVYESSGSVNEWALSRYTVIFALQLGLGSRVHSLFFLHHKNKPNKLFFASSE